MPNRNEHSDTAARDAFQALVKRANKGDEDALAELRQTLSDNPQIWQAVGNLALHARMVLARAIAGGDQFVLDSLLRYANELESSLVAPQSGPLERLAVQRIVAAWLECNYAALQGAEPHGETLKHAKFALEIRESADKRFHAAIRSLALVRQMLPGNASVDHSRHAALAQKPINGNGDHHAVPAHLQVLFGEDGQSHAPVNRIAKHLAARSNGHARRLQVVGEETAAPGPATK
jgi:hypothetical protein